MLGISGLTRRMAETGTVTRKALAAAVESSSARRGFLVIRHPRGQLRLVSRFVKDSGCNGSVELGSLADLAQRAVEGNRSTILTADTCGIVPTGGSSPCTAMASPLRDSSRRAMGAICVYLPISEGGFARRDCHMLRGFAGEISAALEAGATRRLIASHGEQGFETAFAADIRRGLMPMPREDLGACEAGFATHSTPSLGGELLRLARLADGSHAVLAGHVCGKGLPAALMAVKTGEAFRLLARTSRDSSELLRALDEAASSGIRQEIRAWAVVLVLRDDGSRVDVALAGGSCVKLMGTSGRAIWCPDEGRPLGVRVPGARPAPPVMTSLLLNPGDAALVMTKDCLDARDVDGNRYGPYRVEVFARANIAKAAGDFARLLAAEIERFRAGSGRKTGGCIAFIRRKTARMTAGTRPEREIAEIPQD